MRYKIAFRYKQDKAHFVDKGLVDLFGHRNLGNKIETQYCAVYLRYKIAFRYKQDKAHFVDKGLVDLFGHRNLGNKIETQYCAVYKRYFNKYLRITSATPLSSLVFLVT